MMKATILTLLCAAGLLAGAGSAFAQYDGIGAPTSAAGGVASPPSMSSPGAVGPLGGTSGSVMGSSGHSDSSDTSPSVRDLTPGTGKFENPSDPCFGHTGFGSSKTQPGLKC
jgi:hypothetical protein